MRKMEKNEEWGTTLPSIINIITFYYKIIIKLSFGFTLYGD